jgi:hypothetical protein
MKWFKVDNGQLEPTELEKLSVGQLHQTAAIADCLGRLIPVEGVDYDIHVILRGAHDTHVSMQIIPITDKGKWWKEYVGKMIHKYPPTTSYKADVLPDRPTDYKEESNDNKGK